MRKQSRQLQLEYLEDRATPAAFTVDTVSDVPVVGKTTLRQAITAANNAAGADQINIDLPAGSTINLQSALPAITDSVTITAPAAGTTVARNAVAAFRVFEVTSGTVEFKYLTITGGLAPGDRGGGIKNAGTLTLTSCDIWGNAAPSQGVASGWGGGVYNTGTLNLRSTTVHNNQASHGGGIYNDGDDGATAALDLLDSQIFSNSAAYYGGGIDSYRGTLNASNTQIYGNTAVERGGGLYSMLTTVNYQGGLIEANTAWNYGGGIAVNGGTANFTGASIQRNETGAGGVGGGIYVQAGTATLTNSLLMLNTAPTGAGGAYKVGAGTLTLTNTTNQGIDPWNGMA